MTRHALLAAAALLLASPALAQSGAARAPAALTQPTASEDAALAAVLAARSPADRERDAYRRPGEALTFWGLRPGMTILEVQPGAGWWTEILAPYAKATGGRYISTAPDLNNPNLSEGARRARTTLEAKLKDPKYGDVTLVNWGPVSAPLPTAGPSRRGSPTRPCVISPPF
jgi:predicted methyltransferase